MIRSIPLLKIISKRNVLNNISRITLSKGFYSNSKIPTTLAAVLEASRDIGINTLTQNFSSEISTITTETVVEASKELVVDTLTPNLCSNSENTPPPAVDIFNELNVKNEYGNSETPSNLMEVPVSNEIDVDVETLTLHDCLNSKITTTSTAVAEVVEVPSETNENTTTENAAVSNTTATTTTTVESKEKDVNYYSNLFQREWNLEVKPSTPEVQTKSSLSTDTTTNTTINMNKKYDNIKNIKIPPFVLTEDMKPVGFINTSKKRSERVVLYDETIHKQPHTVYYTGEWLHNLPHGKGKLLWADSSKVFEGTFDNGVRTGYGVKIHSDGFYYKGMYEHNQPHGCGTLNRRNGTVYTGEFFQGKYHEKGRLTSPNSTYEGGFWKGLRHGHGVVTTHLTNRKREVTYVFDTELRGSEQKRKTEFEKLCKGQGSGSSGSSSTGTELVSEHKVEIHKNDNILDDSSNTTTNNSSSTTSSSKRTSNSTTASNNSTTTSTSTTKKIPSTTTTANTSPTTIAAPIRTQTSQVEKDIKPIKSTRNTTKNPSTSNKPPSTQAPTNSTTTITSPSTNTTNIRNMRTVQYTGDLIAGKRQGRGKLVYSNGSVYEGEFSQHQCHGVGRLTAADGTVYDGLWWYGQMYGEGRITFPDQQRVFRGKFI